MNQVQPLAFKEEFSDLPKDPEPRHEAFVDFFGRFLFWLRNWSLAASRRLLESQEARESLGTIRRRYYEGASQLTPEQREACMLVAEETLDGFGERLVWFLGGRSTDSRLGRQHAYRFQVTMEIVDVESGDVVETVPITSGGRKFFGKYWGRWLNRHRDK